jgi:catechol 2,3-dioxygenase-like lactoylglutathione lyase family enzyme
MSVSPRWRLALGASLILILVIALSFVVIPVGAAQSPTPGAASAVESVSITVSDLDRSVAFYTSVLNFEKVGEVEIAGDAYEHLHGVFGLRARVATLRLGDERIELVEYLAPRGRPIPVDSRSNDRWFQHVAIIVSDMQQAYARLRQHRVEHASSGPQRLPDWNPNAGGIEAFYFKDPDGHVLEILAFPPDKGAAKWHARDGRLFLGIDHTAIVIRDTETSLAFYRDALGLRVAGASENHGPEQERLNNVFGARLRITGLSAGAGPAVEFLEYLAPRDGRPRDHGWRANDLVHWHTRMAIADLNGAWIRLLAGRYDPISPGPTALADGLLGFQRGLTLRDPDGHAVQLVER